MLGQIHVQTACKTTKTKYWNFI